MRWFFLTPLVAVGAAMMALAAAPTDKVSARRPVLKPLDMNPRPIWTDKSVTYDFDIVYVRAPRPMDGGTGHWAEVADPRRMTPGADLMLLHPNGKEEVLVPVQGRESIADPAVSFDGKWVYYAKLHDAASYKGSDIYKIRVSDRHTVQLTDQDCTPNTGAVRWSAGNAPIGGVYNLGPCPLPGGKLVFVSDRNAFRATNPGYAPHAQALQLYVMDDDGSNVECIGHLNLGSALHPVVLKDGRIMFSTLESQGLRSELLWGLWAIRPDGTHWEPLFSAFDDAPTISDDSLHMQAQLSDGSLVVESYYNLNNAGFGIYYKLPAQRPNSYPAFGPAFKGDRRNPPMRGGRGAYAFFRFPFTPYGLEPLTPFLPKEDLVSPPADPHDPNSPRLGKFTHPGAAPDNHLLTVWSPGSVHAPRKYRPAFDAGIYLIKSGKPIDEPGEMLLIKNDPRYNEQWPRALVSYHRIYGVDEPRLLTPLANDGKLSPHLPAGTPFGLVGTSSLYKRESFPYGSVPARSVTATYAGYRGPYAAPNWIVQGADAGLYDNADIHAIRIVALEPTTQNGGPRGAHFYNHARERMRILGEIPVRKFAGGRQPIDPDGNPDTSFLAKIPADIAWTFQTLDKNGMLLNMAQTWHQLRPGEVRTDCGGCHAHSQKPTPFGRTAAARPDYAIFDLTKHTPLLTTRAHDMSGKLWDVDNQTGLRFEGKVKNVEYFRDVRPIFERSCFACHTRKADQPAGGLVLDDDHVVTARAPADIAFDIRVPASYACLAADRDGKICRKPVGGGGYQAASRYVRMFQSRRSLLIWKIFGRRLDGWTNDDVARGAVLGGSHSSRYKDKPLFDTPPGRARAGLAYTGSIMPPPAATAGTYIGRDGHAIKVAPLTDEDRLTLVRWIDLGCPIDLDYNPDHPGRPGQGWMVDDKRPTLTLTWPRPDANPALSQILVGLDDYESGLDLASFWVAADFRVDGIPAGRNLAPRFKKVAQGVWRLPLARPIKDLPRGHICVAIKDRGGNISMIERKFSVGPSRK